MNRRSLVLAPLFLGLVLTAAPVAAQPSGQRGGPRTLANRVADDSNAQETQRRLQELLQQYPPSLRKVLALDPTLLTNQEYLQPYPQLGAFISQHPEVAHNPTFFFDQELRELSRRYDGETPAAQAIRALDQIMGGIAALVMGLAVVFAVVWVIRTVIEHRKWLRVSKTHVETHARLMDRLTSNEDLMAYMQSPAGRKFLEAAPIPLDGGRKMLNAPFGRILWSVQAGLVVAALGVGLIYAAERLAANETYSLGAMPMEVIGIAALAVGAGFFVSAFMAYALSQRLGLFNGKPAESADSGSGHAA